MTDYKCYDLSWPETRLCSYGLCLADSGCVRAAKLNILRILIKVKWMLTISLDILNSD